MSLSDREFLGDSTEPKREGMSYQTAVKIKDMVVTAYHKSESINPDEKEITEAYNIIRNG